MKKAKVSTASNFTADCEESRSGGQTEAINNNNRSSRQEK